jgi:hypothetical protein
MLEVDVLQGHVDEISKWWIQINEINPQMYIDVDVDGDRRGTTRAVDLTKTNRDPVWNTIVRTNATLGSKLSIKMMDVDWGSGEIGNEKFGVHEMLLPATSFPMWDVGLWGNESVWSDALTLTGKHVYREGHSKTETGASRFKHGSNVTVRFRLRKQAGACTNVCCRERCEKKYTYYVDKDTVVDGLVLPGDKAAINKIKNEVAQTAPPPSCSNPLCRVTLGFGGVFRDDIKVRTRV